MLSPLNSQHWHSQATSREPLLICGRYTRKIIARVGHFFHKLRRGTKHPSWSNENVHRHLPPLYSFVTAEASGRWNKEHCHQRIWGERSGWPNWFPVNAWWWFQVPSELSWSRREETVVHSSGLQESVLHCVCSCPYLHWPRTSKHSINGQWCWVCTGRKQLCWYLNASLGWFCGSNHLWSQEHLAGRTYGAWFTKAFRVKWGCRTGQSNCPGQASRMDEAE